jgi:futalosine hydrolase
MLFPGAVLQPLIDPVRAVPAPSGLYDAWIVAATTAELSWAVGARAADEPSRSGPLWGEVSFEGLRLALVSTGVGSVNAALSLGLFAAGCSTSLLLNCGVAGAYPGSGLGVGQLAVATEEIDADTGIESVLSTECICPLPIPLHYNKELPFGRYPLDAILSEKLEKAASSVTDAKRGPFVTSATVTATGARAQRLGDGYGALCENMEGAALARVALELGVAMVEVRGISNIAGPRDRASWKLEEAIAASGEAVRVFLAELAGEKRVL